MIDVTESTLMIIDFQERLLPAIEGADRLMDAAGRLLTAARHLRVPVLASEQYVKGLGTTAPRLRDRLQDQEIVEKTSFGCVGEPGFMDSFKRVAGARKQVVLTGIEAHICVLQTALGLVQQGYQVYLVTDAVGSRRRHDKKVALSRLQQAGVIAVTFEMVLFEWMQRAGTDDFRALRGLVQ